MAATVEAPACPRCKTNDDVDGDADAFECMACGFVYVCPDLQGSACCSSSEAGFECDCATRGGGYRGEDRPRGMA